MRGDAHDAPSVHEPRFGMVQKNVLAYGKALGRGPSWLIHLRRDCRRSGKNRFKPRPGLSGFLQPGRNGENNAPVPVPVQNGLGVQVVVKKTVVKGKKKATLRQRLAVNEKGLRFLQADAAPSPLGKGAAMVLKALRSKRDPAGPAVDVVVHGYGQALRNAFFHI